MPAGMTVFVSHLPKQQWRETEASLLGRCALRVSGRSLMYRCACLPDAATVDRVLGGYVDARAGR